MAEERKDASGDVHRQEALEVCDAFGVDPEYGLTTDQVDAAREVFGYNELRKGEKTPLWKLVLEQFDDPLVITLLIAMLISAGTNLYDFYNPTHGAPPVGFWESFVEPAVILFILIFNAIVGVWQESNAEAALDALKSLQADHAVVIRDGKHQEIDARELVPGDIFVVKVGDKVPADGRIVRLETSALGVVCQPASASRVTPLPATLRVEQASLTGESETAMKDAHAVLGADDITGKTNLLFASTGVANGRAIAVTIATGMDTELGKIQDAVEDADDDDDETPLKKKIGVFGYQLQVVIFIICVLVWVINFGNFFDEDGFSVKRCLYYLKIAVALAVAAIPEGLPAVITTCLALGTRKMAKKNAIVRKLPSVETLGCTTVICSDKTGTLTTNSMSVVRLVYLDDDDTTIVEHDVEGTTYTPLGEIDGFAGIEGDELGIINLSQVCTLCNEARIVYEDGEFKRLGEPTEAALKVLAEKMGLPDAGGGLTADADPELIASSVSDHWNARFDRVAVLEFSRDRKSMSVLCRPEASAGGGRRRKAADSPNVLFVKGAPEAIISRCTHIRLGTGQTTKMTARTRAVLMKQNEEMAGDALRCIAMAVKEDKFPADMDSYDGEDESHPAHEFLRDPSNFVEAESGLTFVGIAGIVDPPRPEVHESIGLCVQAGIRVVVITGDNQRTAESVCRQIGVFEDDEDLSQVSITGREFMNLSTGEQEAFLLGEGGRVFSRAEPAHKMAIVRLLKANNEVTAMTGDGVNDAPALKAADIGIAMGIAGTEVAKEASDMILADDNFSTIVLAVCEGRSIYSNTKSFIRFLISSNLGEVACIFIAAAIGLPEIMVPVQLLWVNLVTDGPPATALGFNPPDKDIMRKPPRRSDDQLISPWLFFRYTVVGLYVGCATVGVFIYWFVSYSDANDGHDLVTFDQLRTWTTCDPAAIENPDSPWFGFNVTNTGGTDIGENPCNYFSHGKIKAATMSLTSLVAIEMLNALNALSEDGSLLQMPPWCNPWLLAAMALSFGLHFVIMYIPVFAEMFEIAALDSRDWAVCLLFSSPVILIDEVLKFVGRMRTNAEVAARLHHKSD